MKVRSQLLVLPAVLLCSSTCWADPPVATPKNSAPNGGSSAAAQNAKGSPHKPRAYDAPNPYYERFRRSNDKPVAVAGATGMSHGKGSANYRPVPKGYHLPKTRTFLVPKKGEKKRNIFEDHPRQEVTSRETPWRMLGRLNDGCSGAMVGRDLVLTAAHCVIDPQTHDLRQDLAYFDVGLINGEYFRRSQIVHVWWGTKDTASEQQNDWAILKLADPVGDETGYFALANTGNLNTPSSYPNPLIVAGYSGDYMNGNTATADTAAQIREIHPRGTLFHDGSMTRGASGCPVFVNNGQGPDDMVIYAVNVAEYRAGGEASLTKPTYTTEFANIAVPASAFLDTVVKLREGN